MLFCYDSCHPCPSAPAKIHASLRAGWLWFVLDRVSQRPWLIVRDAWGIVESALSPDILQLLLAVQSVPMPPIISRKCRHKHMPAAEIHVWLMLSRSIRNHVSCSWKESILVLLFSTTFIARSVFVESQSLALWWFCVFCVGILSWLAMFPALLLAFPSALAPVVVALLMICSDYPLV